MKRFRILDLFCGAGGAAQGYADAGFEVVGADIEPQPNYPFEFWLTDALDILGMGGVARYLIPEGFDAIHASPPCQHYANVTAWRGDKGDHHRARDAVDKALRCGKIAKPDVCEACGEPPAGRQGLNAHHDDHAKPLEIRWLCPRCHHKLHRDTADISGARR